MLDISAVQPLIKGAKAVSRTMKVQLTKDIRMAGKVVKQGTKCEFPEPFARELMSNERAIEIIEEPKPAKKAGK
jgi:hypothetical protein